ncbi:MAG: iron-containing redox enzyme family protein [Microcoleus sp. PH2017_15_JOR_U_A]|uniref:iron-containing redox enzyme family protein n=1 Tax=unclassified Microcoleus TaxID=2642155 RepID=UPI001DE7953A|nr:MULTISPECIES: iron-containing redox enzyme family protein [unclassified Microcoleus]MCC3476342.1 iron-containing redox enzyme family protein [Microcoleus sp. PH2017_13_LAR_U_A]MCC3488777.1 iron-containing redox enzyme family protein [Microcoleus sp. PH2017_14_LAR_D_A]MCC3497146.1 iron-containing redox enzyme family protein [Microcoleus sp. PH2017_15_JOR_U_A]MCC3595191.1 iron-containing redox enzyme family protein [Microcoleus sp. PH2017_28_MFU_U_A]MCC3601454.1 iron-containing redox enzyme f
MKWLLDLGAQYRQNLLSGSFYKQLALSENPGDVRGWIGQLYHQSSDFTASLAMRYAMCRDFRYQGCFAHHATEEVDHASLLLDWMHKHEFLQPGENPNSIAPTLETQSVSAYCFRSVLRESYDHQVIAMNLISEGVSFDFFSAVIPVFARIGLKTNRYWVVHREIDLDHLAMGIDLIPQCEPDSAQGKEYARIAYETSVLYGRMLDSWTTTNKDQEKTPLVAELVAAR